MVAPVVVSDPVAVIDLGVVGDAADPVVPRRRPALTRRHRRLAGVAAVALGIGLLGGAAAPVPDPVLLRTVPDATGYALVGDTLAVYDQRRTAVIGYDPDTGAERWQRPTPGNARVYAVGDGLALTVDDPISPAGTSFWLDPATGRARWSVQARLLGVTARGAVMVEGTVPRSTILALLSPDTGRALASAQVPDDVPYAWRAGTGEVAWWDADGVVRVRDLRTGADRARAVGLGGGSRAGGAAVTSAAGLWVLVRYGDKEVTVAAFGATDLAPRWVRRLPGQAAELNVLIDPADGSVRSGGPVVSADCGSLLCLPVTSAAGARTVLLDPADGRAVRTEAGIVLPLAAAYGTVTGAADQASGPALVDVASGAAVASGWATGGDAPDGAGRLLLRHDAGDVTALGVFDLAAGRFTALGRVSGDLTGCQYAAPYLMCQGPDGPLTVWRTRRLP